ASVRSVPGRPGTPGRDPLPTAGPALFALLREYGIPVARTEAAASREAALAARLGPRVLVSQTAPPGTELALGLVRDPALGPLLIISAGGILIEIFAERVVLLAPVTRPAALAAIQRLRIAPVLTGARGQPPAYLDAIAAAVESLSRLALDLGDTLDALDLNPLICGPAGALAGDALLIPAPPCI